MSHKEDLTSLLTPEQGKMVIEARGDIGYGISEEARWVRGKIAVSREQDKYQKSEHQRAGECPRVLGGDQADPLRHKLRDRLWQGGHPPPRVYRDAQ